MWILENKEFGLFLRSTDSECGSCELFCDCVGMGCRVQQMIACSLCLIVF